MYYIHTANRTVGYAEAPTYCYKLKNGGVQIIGREDRVKGHVATGVIFGEEIYNLPGHDDFEGAETATVAEVDGGVRLTQQGAELSAARDVSSIAFVALAEVGGIDDATAGEHTELFAPWAAGVAYRINNLRQYGGRLYRCVQAHTSQEDWTPDAAASLWAEVADPAEEWPAWSQPIGAHDAYRAGDKVRHNGARWTSDTDGNVWEPGVYGWTEVTE